MASIEKAQAARPGAQTVIGTGFVVDGEITGSENVVVHGTVKGRVTLREALVVDAGGVVEADVETATLEVAGQLTGNVSASERVELKAESQVTGDIRAPRILISDGALYRGSIDMDVKR
ncbi:MAG TPA: polymer-forming cytoskeletal protein [Anaeromyxobacteraceae bacterium]|nr:polymer-forming cytoskeletal protein [Anaeromyxobacteraceae bacterium]